MAKLATGCCVTGCCCPLGPLGRLAYPPQLVTRELLRWSDVALVMTRAHRDLVADKYPEFARKLALLRDYTATGQGDLEDPMGGDAAIFAACWRDVRAAVTRLVETAEWPPKRTTVLAPGRHKYFSE